MITKSSSVLDIISGNRLLESVVERFGFEKNYYNEELESVCIKTGNDPEFVFQVVKAFSENLPFPVKELSAFPIAQIIDYLKRTHQYYLDKKIPEIEQSFTFLCKDYSFSHPQLLVLASMFMNYKRDLVEHIEVEEYVLFPYINELQKVKDGKKKYQAYGLDKYSISNFHDEHHHEEEVLTKIRTTIERRFRRTIPPLPFRIFLNQIECLETDLLRHAKIEDQVLLPLALKLEHEVKNNQGFI